MMLKHAALLAGACGLALIAMGLWVPAKALLAYGLMDRAADTAARNNAPEQPWLWADFGVIGTLSINNQNIHVLDRATGQALAFGAGQHEEYAALNGPLVISGHRDTHFSGLKDLKNDAGFSYHHFGITRRFKVVSTRVFDTTSEALHAPEPNQILLITCWPFDGIDPSTTQRFLVLGQEI